jgi:hypothetical protein
VPSPKAQKIDYTQEYPCPCRRKGTLVPIALTEALGCNRCQQIFVVEDNGYALEQLSTTYPYKKIWRWLGNRWQPASSGLGESYLPIVMGVVLVLLIVWLPLALRSSGGLQILFFALVSILLAILPALMVWLTYRR